MVKHVFPKGTICKFKGLPFRLTQDCEMEIEEDNYKLFLSQLEHSSENPLHAPSPDK